MRERAARLVTRVRLPDASCLDQANRFPNATEIELVHGAKSRTNGLRCFPRLENLTIGWDGLVSHLFFAQLGRRRVRPELPRQREEVAVRGDFLEQPWSDRGRPLLRHGHSLNCMNT